MFAAESSTRTGRRRTRAATSPIVSSPMFKWNGAGETNWFIGLIKDWAIKMYLGWLNWSVEGHFGRDVRKLALPA